MHEYSLAVALFDYLPVLVAGLGTLCLAKAISQRQAALAPVAWCAALAVPLGGACKASWKLLIALDQPPLPWLENLLFLLLAPGFLTLAACLHRATATSPQSIGWGLVAWAAMAPFGALAAWLVWPEARWWFVWLLALTVLGSTALIIIAIRQARRLALPWPVPAALLYNLVAGFVLSGLSRLPPGESTAWLQEGINLTSQAAFAYGAWQLARALTSTPDRNLS